MSHDYSTQQEEEADRNKMEIVIFFSVWGGDAVIYIFRRNCRLANDKVNGDTGQTEEFRFAPKAR
jgi:sugar phosphate permease